jgi:hypothetical protein
MHVKTVIIWEPETVMLDTLLGLGKYALAHNATEQLAMV